MTVNTVYTVYGRTELGERRGEKAPAEVPRGTKTVIGVRLGRGWTVRALLRRAKPGATGPAELSGMSRALDA